MLSKKVSRSQKKNNKQQTKKKEGEKDQELVSFNTAAETHSGRTQCQDTCEPTSTFVLKRLHNSMCEEDREEMCEEEEEEEEERPVNVPNIRITSDGISVGAN